MPISPVQLFCAIISRLTLHANKHGIFLHARVIFCILLSATLLSCLDEEKPDQPAEHEELVEDIPLEEPKLVIGTTSMPMPPPYGFVRVGQENELFQLVSTSQTEILLCMFVRPNQQPAQTEQHGEDTFLQQDNLQQEPEYEVKSDIIIEPTIDNNANIKELDIVTVSTLSKWINSHFSSEDFNGLKQSWQKNSLSCTTDTISYFIAATTDRLSGFPEYTYNLGMTGYSQEHISFARIIKQKSTTDGNPVYFCEIDSVLYRNGKIIKLSAQTRIWQLNQISNAISEHMEYLQHLQMLDNQLSGNDSQDQILHSGASNLESKAG